MIISRVKLKNWKNFRDVNITLGDRVFLVGPNASGKSNFLDVFRFLRDIAQNGLQKAIENHGKMPKIRCLSARRKPEIEIEIHLADSSDSPTIWKYCIGIKQRKGGKNEPYINYEKVWKSDKLILERPTKDDEKDFVLLTYTHLEQPSQNVNFREINTFFNSIRYSHLIPQLLQHPEDFSPKINYSDDPFGVNFLDKIAHTKNYIKESRIKKIGKVLQIAVPQLKNFSHIKDENEGGASHLEATCEHWRAKGARQREDQFSDGTLRLIGFLWSLLESYSLLLLEEPELSLNTGIIKKLPSLMNSVLRNKKRKSQVMISTHSAELLSDVGIGGEEVIILIPKPEGTVVEKASSNQQINVLLSEGFSVAEAVLPHAEPSNIYQLSFLDEL